MRYVSLFSGIEAASVAWEPLGWEPLLFSEIDEFPSAVPVGAVDVKRRAEAAVAAHLAGRPCADEVVADG